MTSIALTVELRTLAWSALLVLAQIALQACLATLEVGIAYNASPRDEDRPAKNILAGRAQRALRNLLETYAVFAALALALAVSGRSGGLGASGAIIWLAARLVYVPVYLMGIPVLRTLVWIASIVGLLMMWARLIG